VREGIPVAEMPEVEEEELETAQENFAGMRA